jgi:hypothetical protein
MISCTINWTQTVRNHRCSANVPTTVALLSPCVAKPKCKSSALGVEARRLLKVIGVFGKYCNCHLQVITATAVFAQMLDNFQHSIRLVPESRIFTYNSSRELLRTKISQMSSVAMTRMSVHCELGFPLSASPSRFPFRSHRQGSITLGHWYVPVALSHWTPTFTSHITGFLKGSTVRSERSKARDDKPLLHFLS